MFANFLLVPTCTDQQLDMLVLACANDYLLVKKKLHLLTSKDEAAIKGTEGIFLLSLKLLKMQSVCSSAQEPL